MQDFQIIQPAHDEIVIRIVKKTGYTEAHTAFVLKHAGLIVSKIVRLKVELVDSVPLTGFGKIPHFVSKIHTQYT